MNNTYIFGFDSMKDPFIGCFNPDSMKLTQMKFPEEMKINSHSSVLYYSINSILITGGVTKTQKISPQMIAYHPLTNKFTKLPDLLQLRYAHSTIALNGIIYILGGRTYGCDFTSLTNSVESINLTTKQQQKCAPMIKRRCTFNTFVHQGEIYVLGGYSGNKRTRTIEKYNPVKNIWNQLEFKLQRGLEGVQIFSYRPDEIILLGGNSNESETNCCHVMNLQNQNIRALPPMNRSRIMHKISYNDQYLIAIGGDLEGSFERASFETCWQWEMLENSHIDFSQFDQTNITFADISAFNFSSQTLVVQSQQSNPLPLTTQTTPLITSLPISEISEQQKIGDKQEQTEEADQKDGTKNSFQLSIFSTSNTNSSTHSSPSSADVSFQDSFKSDDFDHEEKEQDQDSNFIEIEKMEKEKDDFEEKFDNTHCFFGNDDKPFVTVINPPLKSVVTIPCPLELRLLCYMSGVKINQNEYFISGGISSNLANISKEAYIYNSSTNRAKKVKQMNYNRYAHTSCLLGNYVYIIGGRGYQGDKLSLYDTCQRFNLKTQKWEIIASMSEAKCSLNCFQMNGHIYVVGGYVGDGNRTQKIQKYDTVNNEWVLLDHVLVNEIQASFVIPNQKKNSFLMIGGKQKDQNLKSIKEVLLTIPNSLSPSLNQENPEDEDNEKYLTQKNIGQMKVDRCLAKCIQLSDNEIIVFGGISDKYQENIVEIFHLNQTSLEESYSDLCSKLSNSFQFMNIFDKISSLLLI